jgi:hypothetical protein
MTKRTKKSKRRRSKRQLAERQLVARLGAELKHRAPPEVLAKALDAMRVIIAGRK